MARKKSSKRRAAPRAPRTRTKTVKSVVYRYRQRRAAQRTGHRVTRDDSLNIGKIVRGSFAVGFGMIIAKVATNKLTAGGSETEKWTWPNIFMSGAASMVAAFVCGALFKAKKPTVALIAMGGVGLALYKMFTTKFAPQWGWTSSWFGADSDINPELFGADDFEVVDYAPEVSYGNLPGQIMGATDSGGQLVAYNPAMGATDTGGRTVAYNPAFGADDYGAMSRRIASSYPGSY